MKTPVGTLAFVWSALLCNGLWGCEGPLPVIPKKAQVDVPPLDAMKPGESEVLHPTTRMEPGESPDIQEDSFTAKDTNVGQDTDDEEPPRESDAVAIEDTWSQPDVEEEDLSNVKLTWTNDIEPISINKCDNCHGKDGNHGLKLYTKQKWIDYFPMIVPALQKGSMPQGTSLAPGQLEDIVMWGKVGHP